jgi:S-DNA-T family DNA segregation ATPase FtsK/SpoIIIE
LFQAAKNDLTKYKNCKQVKKFVLGDINEIDDALEEVIFEMKRRTKLMLPMVEALKGDNLYDYNCQHKEKLPYIYVIIDEFIELMPDKADVKEEKDTKNNIMSNLRKIAQFGGALGITYIIAHQKPEKELMPTFLKNQSLIRICLDLPIWCVLR